MGSHQNCVLVLSPLISTSFISIPSSWDTIVGDVLSQCPSETKIALFEVVNTAVNPPDVQYFTWGGEFCAEGTIAIAPRVAAAFGYVVAMPLKVRILGPTFVHAATSVHVSPASADDSEIVELLTEEIERVCIQFQRVVYSGLTFQLPVLSSNVSVSLTVDSVFGAASTADDSCLAPNPAPLPLGLLTTETELVVMLRPRCAAPPLPLACPYLPYRHAPVRVAGFLSADESSAVPGRVVLCGAAIQLLRWQDVTTVAVHCTPYDCQGPAQVQSRPLRTLPSTDAAPSVPVSVSAPSAPSPSEPILCTLHPAAAMMSKCSCAMLTKGLYVPWPPARASTDATCAGAAPEFLLEVLSCVFVSADVPVALGQTICLVPQFQSPPRFAVESLHDVLFGEPRPQRRLNLSQLVAAASEDAVAIDSFCDLPASMESRQLPPVQQAVRVSEPSDFVSCPSTTSDEDDASVQSDSDSTCTLVSGDGDGADTGTVVENVCALEAIVESWRTDPLLKALNACPPSVAQFRWPPKSSLFSSGDGETCSPLQSLTWPLQLWPDAINSAMALLGPLTASTSHCLPVQPSLSLLEDIESSIVNNAGSDAVSSTVHPAVPMQLASLLASDSFACTALGPVAHHLKSPSMFPILPAAGTLITGSPGSGLTTALSMIRRAVEGICSTVPPVFASTVASVCNCGTGLSDDFDSVTCTSASELTEKLVIDGARLAGSSETDIIAQLSKYAAHSFVHAPCVVFVNRIDLLCPPPEKRNITSTRLGTPRVVDFFINWGLAGRSMLVPQSASQPSFDACPCHAYHSHGKIADLSSMDDMDLFSGGICVCGRVASTVGSFWRSIGWANTRDGHCKTLDGTCLRAADLYPPQVVFVMSAASADSVHPLMLQNGLLAHHVALPPVGALAKASVCSVALKALDIAIDPRILAGWTMDSGPLATASLRDCVVFAKRFASRVTCLGLAAATKDELIRYRPVGPDALSGRHGKYPAVVGGSRDVLRVLHDTVLMPIRSPHFIKRFPMRIPNGVLLYGAPGCGKTFLVKSFLQHHDIRSVVVNGPEFLNKYIGQSEARVNTAFATARSHAPCVLFVDELDAIVSQRGGHGSGALDRVVNAFLCALDGTSGLAASGVFFIATSCRPDMLDTAVLRPGRLDRKVRVHYPRTVEETIEVLNACVVSLGITMCTSGYEQYGNSWSSYIAQRTLQFSQSDLKGVLVSAGLAAQRRFRNASRDSDAGAVASSDASSVVMYSAGNMDTKSLAELTVGIDKLRSLTGGEDSETAGSSRTSSMEINKDDVDIALSSSSRALTSRDVAHFTGIYDRWENPKSMQPHVGKKQTLA